MNVLILGATGSVGRHLVPQALAHGHEVTTLVRNPAKLETHHERLRVLQGDALDASAADGAVQGQDAVIMALGRSNHRKPTTMFSDATGVLVTAMENHGVKRLVCITGIGAGDSRGHGGFWYDRLIFPLITKQTYLDKGRQEELIRNSSLDWIIVRPASFTNGPLHGNLRVATELSGVTIRSISRADTAAFVLQQLTDNTYLRKTPLVGY